MRNTTANYDLVIGAKDMLRIREKIKHLYPSKTIVTAPCVSKLYSSKEMKVFDFDGKSSPNWSYFAQGIIAIIYDECYRDVLLALFDENDVRLLWCLKWAKYITLEMTVSHFHVLNTNPNFSHHIGIFYDDKNVADLMLNTINIFGKNFRHNIVESADQSNSKLHSVQKKRSNSCNIGKTKTDSNSAVLKRFSLPDVLKRKPSINKSKDNYENDKGKLKNEQKKLIIHDTSHVSRFLRHHYYMKRNSLSLCEEVDIKNEIFIKSENGKNSMRLKEFDYTENESENNNIFLLQKLSRTRSLIQTKVKSDISQCKLQVQDKLPDPKDYERKIKLTKTRSSSDILLLHDKTMRYVIDTAHVARSIRENKYFLKNMKDRNLESTDLCVTDL